MSPIWFEPYGGDPVPVNLDVVRALMGMLSTTAEAASTINQTVAGIAQSADAGVWVGESADAFRAKLANLPELVGKVERSYGGAAEAVRAFLVAAEQARADSESLSGSAAAVSDESATVAVLDPAAADSASRTAAAEQAVADMTARVAALRDDYLRAETTLTDALGVAKAEGIPPDSFWHKLVVAVEEWAGEVGLVLAAIAVIALAVVVVFATAGLGLGVLAALGIALETIGPLLAAMTVAEGAGLAAGVTRRVQYGDDDGGARSWESLGMESALFLVPMLAGKAIKVLGQGGGGSTDELATVVDDIARSVDDGSTPVDDLVRGVNDLGRPTPAGAAPHNAGAAFPTQSNYMAPGDRFAFYATKAPAEPGFHDVIAHGDGHTFGPSPGSWANGTTFDSEAMANLLKNDPSYPGGPIRLLSCKQGAPGSTAAQELANKMGVEVLAPTDILWVNEEGRLTIGMTRMMNTGEWKLFKPGGQP